MVRISPPTVVLYQICDPRNTQAVASSEVGEENLILHLLFAHSGEYSLMTRSSSHPMMSDLDLALIRLV